MSETSRENTFKHDFMLSTKSRRNLFRGGNVSKAKGLLDYEFSSCRKSEKYWGPTKEDAELKFGSQLINYTSVQRYTFFHF